MDTPITPVELSDGDLLLRPLRPEDADSVFTSCQDPEIQRWTTVPSPYSREDAEWFVASCEERWASGNPVFAVVDAGTGELLAAIDLQGVADEQGPMVGFWVAPEARGRGVAARAVRCVARWAFDDLHLPRIRWAAYVGNVGSRRTAERVGFVHEGTCRLALVQRGARHDGWFASLLPTDLTRAAAAPASRPALLDGWPDSPVTLRTERLLLRPYRESDAESLLAYSRDPEASIWDPDDLTDLASAKAVAGRRADWSHGRHAAWVIASPDDTEVLGGIQLQLIDPENANAEIGYGLLEHARGRGLTAEALSAVTEWAFAALALERIGLLHAVENEASCSVAERAGYRLEGRLRQSHRFGDGELHDEHLHARLRSDPPTP